jgi:hypothetical protein
MKRPTALVAVILGLGVSLALIHSTRKPHGPKLNIRFVGVTNTMGTSYAVFTLRAAGSIGVHVADPIIELLQRPPVIGGGLCYKTRLSSAGQPATVKVALPKTQDEWRVAFYYHPVSLGQQLSETLARLLGMCGLQMRGRSMVVSSAHSDWMEPTSQVDWLGSDRMKP